MDHYSRFPWVKNKDAATLAKILLHDLEPLIGPPKQLLSDQCAELIGQVCIWLDRLARSPPNGF